MTQPRTLIADQSIEDAILLMRGQKVLLDRDLASLYGVTTGNLNKAVNRNLDRFPGDFMFQLTAEETEFLRFHFGSLKRGQHYKYLRSPASCAHIVRCRSTSASCAPSFGSEKR